MIDVRRLTKRQALSLGIFGTIGAGLLALFFWIAGEFTRTPAFRVFGVLCGLLALGALVETIVTQRKRRMTRHM